MLLFDLKNAADWWGILLRIVSGVDAGGHVRRLLTSSRRFRQPYRGGRSRSR
jgi:hypothetical protein